MPAVNLAFSAPMLKAKSSLLELLHSLLSTTGALLPMELVARYSPVTQLDRSQQHES